MVNNSQTPTEQNFDETELGLQPPDIKNRFLFNYIKSLSFLLGRDEDNLIWRMLRTDASGNLKVTDSAQAKLSPHESVISLPAGVNTKILLFNPLRKKYVIANNRANGTTPPRLVFISYGNNPLNNTINVAPGWAFYDDSYNGDVYAKCSSGSSFIDVMEFF